MTTFRIVVLRGGYIFVAIASLLHFFILVEIFLTSQSNKKKVNKGKQKLGVKETPIERNSSLRVCVNRTSGTRPLERL